MHFILRGIKKNHEYLKYSFFIKCKSLISMEALMNYQLDRSRRNRWPNRYSWLPAGRAGRRSRRWPSGMLVPASRAGTRTGSGPASWPRTGRRCRTGWTRTGWACCCSRRPCSPCGTDTKSCRNPARSCTWRARCTCCWCSSTPPPDTADRNSLFAINCMNYRSIISSNIMNNDSMFLSNIIWRIIIRFSIEIQYEL